MADPTVDFTPPAGMSQGAFNTWLRGATGGLRGIFINPSQAWDQYQQGKFRLTIPQSALGGAVPYNTVGSSTLPGLSELAFTPNPFGSSGGAPAQVRTSAPAPAPAAPPTGAAPTVTNAPDPFSSTGGISPDLQSLINNTKDPNLRAYLQQAAATATSSVNVFGSSLDLKAPVVARVANKPGVGPMLASEQQVPVYGQTTTGDQLTNLYKMDANSLRQLQMQLWANGWYQAQGLTQANQVNFGRVDKGTLAAYSDVLANSARQFAAGQRITVEGTIAQGSPDYQKQAKVPSSLRKLANPIVSSQAIYNANLSLTGNYATPTETSAFQNWYQQQVQQAYQDYQSAGGVNAGLYYSPPSVTDAANAYVQSHSQAQVQGFQTASRMLEFYKLMGVNI